MNALLSRVRQNFAALVAANEIKLRYQTDVIVSLSTSSRAKMRLLDEVTLSLFERRRHGISRQGLVVYDFYFVVHNVIFF